MVEALYRTMREKGIDLKPTVGGDIEVVAFAGVMTDDLRSRLCSCKPEMYDYLTTIEETSSILEIELGLAPGPARISAVKVVNHYRLCDSEDMQRKRIRHHLQFQEAEAACWKALGCGLEILDLRLEGGAAC